eukprot:Colp12_sorted_trinity150504_noHs@17482
MVKFTIKKDMTPERLALVQQFIKIKKSNKESGKDDDKKEQVENDEKQKRLQEQREMERLNSVGSAPDEEGRPDAAIEVEDEEGAEEDSNPLKRRKISQSEEETTRERRNSDDYGRVEYQKAKMIQPQVPMHHPHMYRPPRPLSYGTHMTSSYRPQFFKPQLMRAYQPKPVYTPVPVGMQRTMMPRPQPFMAFGRASLLGAPGPGMPGQGSGLLATPPGGIGLPPRPPDRRLMRPPYYQ